MQEPKRYTPYSSGVIQDSTGKYVTYESYCELKNLTDRLCQAADKVLSDHMDPSALYKLQIALRNILYLPPIDPEPEVNSNEIITDQIIDSVWGNADFGLQESKRETVNRCLLQFACGYHTGKTSRSILFELGLLSDKNKLTKTGQEYLWSVYGKKAHL